MLWWLNSRRGVADAANWPKNCNGLGTGVYQKKDSKPSKHTMFLPILRYWELRLGGVGLKKPSWEMQKSEALPYVVVNEPHRESSKTGSFLYTSGDLHGGQQKVKPNQAQNS